MNHDEAWDRIPWLVNGRAEEAERERIEAHLRVCEECRIELAVQRQVMSAIASDKRIDVVPGTAFERLWDRISADALDEELDEEETPEAVEKRGEPRLPAQSQTTLRSGLRGRAASVAPIIDAGRRRSMTRWLVAAVIVEAVGLVALTAALSSRTLDTHSASSASNTPPAEYRTVTSPTAQPARGVIRAVFQPTLRVSDLQQLLEQSRLQIVSGPTEAGVYTLAASGTEDEARVDTALAELRAHPSVRFAEPVAK